MPSQAGRSTGEQRQHLLTLLTPVVSASGFDLEDVSVRVVGRRRQVRVVIDHDDGVDLDGIATVSREVSAALDGDADDPFTDSYLLEVSSPGVDRLLTERRHWARAVGRLVVVNGAAARVRSVADAGVELSTDGQTRTVRWDELGPGAVQVEFNRKAAFDDEAAGEG
jgi:ribosome maturation factor RimP